MFSILPEKKTILAINAITSGTMIVSNAVRILLFILFIFMEYNPPFVV